MGHDANPSFAVKSYTSLPTLTPPPFAILINVVLQALKDINFAAIRVLAAHDLQVVTRTCPTYFIINSSVTFGCDCVLTVPCFLKQMALLYSSITRPPAGLIKLHSIPHPTDQHGQYDKSATNTIFH